MGNLRNTAKKSYGNRKRWDEDFKDEQYKIPNKPSRNRLFNEIVPVPMHYVEFDSKNKGGKTGFYELCVNWNFDTEEHADLGCPMCEQGIRITTYSYGYLINRSEQRKGNLQVRPVRLTPKHTSDIVKLSDIAFEDGEAPEGWEDDEELPDATDPRFGFDIMISVENNNNTTEYKASVAMKSPLVSLTKEEYRAFKTYVTQVNFGELAKKGQPSVAEVQKKLESLGLLGEGKGEDKGLGKKKKAKSDDDYDAYDDSVPEDGDDGDEPAPKAKKKAKKKTKTQKVSAVGEDSDEGDAEEEGDDDGESRNYATTDEDEAPDADGDADGDEDGDLPWDDEDED